MAAVQVTEEIEREIANLMAELGIEREVAMMILGLVPPPEVFGDGDLVCLTPLTADQRRGLGLGRDPDEVMAERRARQAREAAAPTVAADIRDDSVSNPATDGARRGRISGRQNRAARSTATGGSDR